MTLKTITKNDFYASSNYEGYIFGTHVDGSIVAYLDMTISESGRLCRCFKLIFDDVGIIGNYELGTEVFIFSNSQLKRYKDENKLFILDELKISNAELIKSKIEMLIYKYYPKLMERTLVGYKYETEEERILNDVNTYTMRVGIGSEEFLISKVKQEVKIFNKSSIKIPFIEFELDKDTYLTSVQLYETRQSLERLLKKSYMSPFDNKSLLNLTSEVVSLQNKLKSKLVY